MNKSVAEIVLVEDNEDEAEMTIRALKKSNLTNIAHLKDGVEALEFLLGTGEFLGRNIEEKPKVILLDLKMPKMNGIEVLEKLKANDVTKVIPVIILTSSKENPDIAKCYALGANSYIVKPVDFTSFMTAVSQLGIYWTTLNHQPGRIQDPEL